MKPMSGFAVSVSLAVACNDSTGFSGTVCIRRYRVQLSIRAHLVLKRLEPQCLFSLFSTWNGIFLFYSKCAAKLFGQLYLLGDLPVLVECVHCRPGMVQDLVCFHFLCLKSAESMVEQQVFTQRAEGGIH